MRPQALQGISSTRFRWGVLAIFGIALTLRVWHALQIRGAPFHDMALGDSAVFDAWAREISGGDWVGKEVFWYAPLYPYFLGAVYVALGDDPLTVRLVQAVLGAVSCVLLTLAGRRFFSAPAGLAAGSLLALNGPGIFYDALIHKPVLATLFLCLMLYLLGRLSESPGWRMGWFGLGVATAALTLSRENGLVFAFAILLWSLLLLDRVALRLRVARAGIFVAGLGVMLLPVAMRNQMVGGEFHLTASNLGSNLYIGNSPQATGTYVPLRPGRGLPRFERQDATEMAEAAAGPRLSPADVSSYWTRRALDYVASQPGDWLVLMGRKLLLLGNALELPDSEDLYTHEAASWPLRFLDPLMHFGVLAPLAVLGLWVTWSDRRRHSILYLMAAGYSLSVVVFFVFGRFRFPLTVLAALWAGAGLAGLARFRASASPASMVGCAGAMAIVALACNWPIGSKDRVRSGTQVFIANEFQVADRLDEAEVHLRRAIELDPANAPAHFNLGATLAARGRAAEAIASYREAVRLAPDYAKARVNLGVMLARQNDLSAAETQFREALRHEPRNPMSLVNLSRVLQLTGRHDEAIAQAERAVDLTARGDLEALERLEGSYAAAGRLDRAAGTARAELDLARRAGDAQRSQELRVRIEAYEKAGLSGTAR